MSRKIARTLSTLAIAATPFVAMSAPAAYAADGCSVNNASTSTSVHVEITYPPLTATFDSPSVYCDYVTDSTAVNWTCTLYTGTCEVHDDGVLAARCRATANATCSGTFPTTPGSVIQLTVAGGSGSVSDAAA